MNRLVIFFCACFFGACSSPRPGAVDEENAAIDLDACIASGAACMQNGAAPTDSFFPGSHAVLLPPKGVLTAPLQVPSPTAKLAYLVVALNTHGDRDSPHHLAVTVDGIPLRVKCGTERSVDAGACLVPLPSFTRTEIDERVDGRPIVSSASGTTTVRLEAVDGEGFEVIYVAGRWMQ